MGFLFENLRVYQRGLAFAEEIVRLTARPPKGSAETVDQLRRAAMSIPTNIAEGSGRKHANDRNQFFWVARGSTNECVVHLRLAVQLRVLSESDYQRLRLTLEVIAKMLTKLIAVNTGNPQQTSSAGTSAANVVNRK